MDVGFFSPCYADVSASTPSLFIDGLRHGLTQLGIKVHLYSAGDDKTDHWYQLSRDFPNLDALLLPLDNGEQLGISRHVARLFPSVPILLTGNFFDGVYRELQQLSTAKILREVFAAENSGKDSLVESLADTFERHWNPDVYQGVLNVRESIIGKNHEPSFLPVNFNHESPQLEELAFPVLRSAVKRDSQAVKSEYVVVVDSPREGSHFVATIEENVGLRPIRLVVADRSLGWISATQAGKVRNREELFKMCSGADLVISVSPEAGYSAVSVGALSVGTPLAAPYSSSYRDLLPGSLSLSPGFSFSRSVAGLFDALTARGGNWGEIAEQQRGRVTQFCDSGIIAKKIIDCVKDHRFFLKEEIERFGTQISLAKFVMLGEAIE